MTISFCPRFSTSIILRALQVYIPYIEIYYGHFLRNPIIAPLVTPTKTEQYAYVIKTEEKGSDVNLAVHLLNDAWLNKPIKLPKLGYKLVLTHSLLK